jgi:hypothetical protein
MVLFVSKDGLRVFGLALTLPSPQGEDDVRKLATHTDPVHAEQFISQMVCCRTYLFTLEDRSVRDIAER